MSKTAVVILNYNGADYLKKFLPSVIQWSGDADIIVADNLSTDQSLKILLEDFPSVQTIALEKNYGFAGGYQKALKMIEAEYFVLLNSDVEVTEGWVTTLIDFLENHPDYAACQPKIKDYHHRATFEYAGAAGGFIDTLGYPYCRGRIFDSLEIDHGQYDEPIDIFWATGACLAIRSSAYYEAGGFDEDFFAHMEEIDLCWRLHSLGYKTKALPASTVYHVGGGTLGKQSPFKTYLNFRNGLILLIKNLPYHQLIFKLPLRIALDWVAAINYMLQRRGKHSFSILKAHFAVLGTFYHTLKKREKPSPIPSSKIILVDYFIRGKRKFSDF